MIVSAPLWLHRVGKQVELGSLITQWWFFCSIVSLLFHLSRVTGDPILGTFLLCNFCVKHQVWHNLVLETWGDKGKTDTQTFFLCLRKSWDSAGDACAHKEVLIAASWKPSAFITCSPRRKGELVCVGVHYQAINIWDREVVGRPCLLYTLSTFAHGLEEGFANSPSLIQRRLCQCLWV